MGFYRAMENLNLMQHVDAISSNSGGTWASAIYMFANVTPTELLGERTHPGEFTSDTESPHSIYRAPSSMGATVLPHSPILGSLRSGSSQKLEDAYVDFVASTILKPFGLGNLSTMMAGTEADVRRIKKENPGLRNVTFRTPLPQRPKVFIMGSTLLGPPGYDSPSGYAHFQMSPDYTGIPFTPNNEATVFVPKAAGSDQNLSLRVGGGLVESFAFGGDEPNAEERAGGPDRVPLPPPAVPLSLAKAVGTSSAAIAMALRDQNFAAGLNPHSRMWPIGASAEERTSRIMMLGDGAFSENTGVMALLQRGATRIVMVLSNSPKLPPQHQYDFCSHLGSNLDFMPLEELEQYISGDLLQFFGYGRNEDPYYLQHNQVFDKAELPRTICEMQRRGNAGYSAVTTFKYRVLKNTWWGITGGQDIELLIHDLDSCMEFRGLLKPEILELLVDSTFPHFETVRYFRPSYVGQSALEAWEQNLLAAQSEYFVYRNLLKFQKLLCPQGDPDAC